MLINTFSFLARSRCLRFCLLSSLSYFELASFLGGMSTWWFNQPLAALGLCFYNSSSKSQSHWPSLGQCPLLYRLYGQGIAMFSLSKSVRPCTLGMESTSPSLHEQRRRVSWFLRGRVGYWALKNDCSLTQKNYYSCGRQHRSIFRYAKIQKVNHPLLLLKNCLKK